MLHQPFDRGRGPLLGDPSCETLEESLASDHLPQRVDQHLEDGPQRDDPIPADIVIEPGRERVDAGFGKLARRGMRVRNQHFCQFRGALELKEARVDVITCQDPTLLAGHAAVRASQRPAKCLLLRITKDPTPQALDRSASQLATDLRRDRLRDSDQERSSQGLHASEATVSRPTRSDHLVHRLRSSARGAAGRRGAARRGSPALVDDHADGIVGLRPRR